MKKKFTVIALSSLNDTHKLQMLKYVYNQLKELEQEYSKFQKWYQTKVIKEIGTNREVLIILFKDKIAGIAILKRGSEKKICTLRVIDHFQKMGLGKSLMEMCFEYLDTEKPLITVSSCRFHQFKKLFDFYNFKQEGLYLHKYNKIYNELTFNGILIEKNKLVQGNLFSEKYLMDLTKEMKSNDIIIKDKLLSNTNNIKVETLIGNGLTNTQKQKIYNERFNMLLPFDVDFGDVQTPRFAFEAKNMPIPFGFDNVD
jgi:hypothetical protein